MDHELIRTLEAAGIDPTLEGGMPSLPLRIDEEGRVSPPGDPVPVLAGDRIALVTLKETSELLVGDRRPPDFAGTPPVEYDAFFYMIEFAAADYVACTGETVRDEEFERIYGDLRRRPDGRNTDPLFLHVQAAIRLYLSLRNVSRFEYEAVLRRLQRSARFWSSGPTSTGYHDRVLVPFVLSPTRTRHGAE